MTEKIEKLKELLGLAPLPGEGGFYAETYRSEETITPDCLPARYAGARSFATAIYYLLTQETFSAMHRLQSDEIYHFYLGDPVELLVLERGTPGAIVTLGNDPALGMRPQFAVPRGAWQGSRLKAGGEFALMGTTVTPGFDFADWALGERNTLIASFPRFKEIIAKLTR